jgi:hypothetical protein
LVVSEKSFHGFSDVHENFGNTLQPTALVHEVFLRLVEVQSVSWRDRAHFFAISANMMRKILVDRARQRDGQARRKATGHLLLKLSNPF